MLSLYPKIYFHARRLKERKKNANLVIHSNGKNLKKDTGGNTHPKKNIFLALKVMKYKRYLKLNN